MKACELDTVCVKCYIAWHDTGGSACAPVGSFLHPRMTWCIHSLPQRMLFLWLLLLLLSSQCTKLFTFRENQIYCYTRTHQGASPGDHAVALQAARCATQTTKPAADHTMGHKVYAKPPENFTALMALPMQSKKGTFMRKKTKYLIRWLCTAAIVHW